jgi:hypothetical protein
MDAALSAQSFSASGGSDPSARVAVMVEYQGARIPAEWLLQLRGVLRSRAGRGGNLGIAGVLIHV